MKAPSRVLSAVVFAALLISGIPARAADPPVIVEQPQSQTVVVGGTATFHVEVTGTPPFGYRWRRNGVTVQTGDSPTLIISNVQSNNAGVYSVVITNAANMVPGVLSSNAVLTVVNSPTNQPVPAGNLISMTNIWRYDQS